MSKRELMRMRDRYPTASRMTHWRMRQEPDFPDAVVIRNVEYFYTDELDAYEERRRRRKARPAACGAEAKPNNI